MFSCDDLNEPAKYGTVGWAPATTVGRF